MVGVWDTVRALGLRLPGRPALRGPLDPDLRFLGLRVPLTWRAAPDPFRFHNHMLGPRIRHGFHALALDENRLAFEPVLWNCPADFAGRVEQVWFRGAHGDVGGHILGWARARPLSNSPLVWMLEKAEDRGLALPEGWRGRFDLDAEAPPTGTYRRWGRFFLLRRRRSPGGDRSEYVHPSAAPRGNLPLAPGVIPPPAAAADGGHSDSRTSA